MAMITSTLMLFPPIGWWQALTACEKLYLDTSVPFRKMGWNNRYRIATANGPLLLSVPVVGGRSLRQPLHEVRIAPGADWQKQHWRSFFSAYGRAPFFEHYGPEIEQILFTPFDTLLELNQAALQWTLRSLRLTFPVEITAGAGKDELLAAAADQSGKVRYSQVFESRNGFLPGLSILDLLMNEGPAAAALLSAGSLE